MVLATSTLAILLAASSAHLPQSRAEETLPSPATKTPAGPAGTDYALHGFFGTGENTEVSLRRIGSEKSEWYPLGKKSGDVLVEQADAKNGVVVIVVGKSRQTLRLAGETPVLTQEEKDVLIKENLAALDAITSDWSNDQRKS